MAGCSGAPTQSALPQVAKSASQNYAVPATSAHAAVWKSAHPQTQPGTHAAPQIVIQSDCLDYYYGPDAISHEVTDADTYLYTDCTYTDVGGAPYMPSPGGPIGGDPTCVASSSTGAQKTTASICLPTGGLVATFAPYAGATCDNSPSALGTSNMASSSGPVESSEATTVVDITGLKGSPLGTAYAWVYETEDQNIFIQYNPAVGGSAFANWFGGVMAGVPFAGPGIATTINSIVNTAANPTQITMQQWDQIIVGIDADNAANNNHGAVIHSCFSATLPLG